MTTQATITADLLTWEHEDGMCKLIRVPRNEIDEDDDEDDAWDLLWIQGSTNLRLFDVRLDAAYRRADELSRHDRQMIAEYAATAPDEAQRILRPFGM